MRKSKKNTLTTTVERTFSEAATTAINDLIQSGGIVDTIVMDGPLNSLERWEHVFQNRVRGKYLLSVEWSNVVQIVPVLWDGDHLHLNMPR